MRLNVLTIMNKVVTFKLFIYLELCVCVKLKLKKPWCSLQGWFKWGLNAIMLHYNWIILLPQIENIRQSVLNLHFSWLSVGFISACVEYMAEVTNLHTPYKMRDHKNSILYFISSALIKLFHMCLHIVHKSQ